MSVLSIDSGSRFGPIPTSPGQEPLVHRGWTLVRLTTEQLSVVVNPEKGGEILSIRRVDDGLELLWQSPWGVRHKGAPGGGGGSLPRIIEQYPGGWQTVFPNGGDACIEHGVEWGMHGEVWLSPFDIVATEPTGLVLETRLVRSPFRIVKHIVVDADRVTVTETATNEGSVPIEVMWSHHPAFGPPLIGPETMLQLDGAVVVADNERPATDIAVGRTPWPYAEGHAGTMIDLRSVPDSGVTVQRLLYLTELLEGRVVIANTRCDAAVTLEWDVGVMPSAWYWLEAGGTTTFPWFGAVSVLAIEPATTIPGHGIAHARHTGEQLLTMEPGRPTTASVGLRLQRHQSTVGDVP